MIAPFLTSLDCPKALTQNCNKQTQKLTKTRCISYYIFPLYFRPKQSYATLRQLEQVWAIKNFFFTYKIY